MPFLLNVHFHKCLRFLELIVNLIGTGVCYGSGLWVIDKIRGQTVVSGSDSLLIFAICV